MSVSSEAGARQRGEVIRPGREPLVNGRWCLTAPFNVKSIVARSARLMKHPGPVSFP